jgi:hypothetical protein
MSRERVLQELTQCRFFIVYHRDLDVHTGSALEHLCRGRSVITVLNVECSHVPCLQPYEERFAMFCSNGRDCVPLPRETAALVLKRTAPSRWHIVGYCNFHSILPPTEYCALIPFGTATVSQATYEQISDLQARLLHPLKQLLAGTGYSLSVEDVLFDPAHLSSADDTVISEINQVIHESLKSMFHGSPDAPKIMNRLRSVLQSRNMSDATRFRDVVENALFNVQQHHCTADHVRSARDECVALYSSDTHFQRLLDKDHSHVKALVQLLNVSTIVVKEQLSLDSLRNYSVKHGLQQPESRLNIVDVAVFNDISRIMYQDAKLTTTAARVHVTSELRGVVELLSDHERSRLQHLDNVVRKTPTPLEKCTMILMVAVRMFDWMSLMIQSDDSCFIEPDDEGEDVLAGGDDPDSPRCEAAGGYIAPATAPATIIATTTTTSVGLAFGSLHPSEFSEDDGVDEGGD